MVKIIAAIALCGCQIANAMTVSEFEKFKETPEIRLQAEIFVTGLGEGMGWAQSFYEGLGSKSMYCPPSKLALRRENYVDILEEQAIRMKPSDDVGVVLLAGLIRIFPCK